LEDTRLNGYPPRQQRAFIVAKVLELTRIAIVGSECLDLAAACKTIPVTTMEVTLALAQHGLSQQSDVPSMLYA
jgi:hypothetical protein